MFSSLRPSLQITVYTDYSSTNPPYSRDRERDSEKLLQVPRPSHMHHLTPSHPHQASLTLSPSQSFSRNDWTHVCLAHMFTAREFKDNRLGVAYVASEKPKDTGGICSPCEIHTLIPSLHYHSSPLTLTPPSSPHPSLIDPNILGQRKKIERGGGRVIKKKSGGGG